jgi:hypothetical protein
MGPISRPKIKSRSKLIGQAMGKRITINIHTNQTMFAPIAVRMRSIE